MLLDHALDDVVIILIYPHTLQQVARHVVAGGHEPPQGEACRVLHADCLRQHHATRLAAVDEHSTLRLVLAQAVIHVLDGDAHDEHDESRHQPCEEQLAEADDGQPLVGVQEEAQCLDTNDSEHVGCRYAVEVGKAGVAHHAAVGVEDPEADEVRDEVDNQSRQQVPEGERRGKSTVRQGIDNQIGYDYNKAVEQQHHPVGHGILREIPVCKFCEYVVHC